jgi:hypothetical protein
MQLPELKRNITCNGFFIYAACDEKYFDEFGKSFINSAKLNAKCQIHLHLFNPRQDQLDFCNYKNISYTFEYVPLEYFKNAEQKWLTVPGNQNEKSKYDRILGAMEKSDDKSIIERLQKTYFACARFIRLAQLTKSHPSFFAMDVDAIIRKEITQMPHDNDFYMYSISGRKARTLAGALFSSSAKGLLFLNEYASVLTHNITSDYLYWGLDQDVLPDLLQKYQVGQLPMSYIDWEMQPNSAVWTAKGKRKDLETFISEKQKYSS